MLRPRIPRRMLLTAAATSVALTDPPEKKPSIYPAPEQEVVLVEEPSVLEEKIRLVRRKVIGTLLEAYSRVHGYVSRWIAIEHSVENRIKSLSSPHERLTPGLLYVGVATLSGSIIARNRRLPTRLLLPPSLFILTMHHFLPQTTHNVSAYLNELEERHFPALAEKQRVGRAHVQMTVHNVKEWTKDSRERFGRGVESVVDRLQEFTGLRVREGLGWSKTLASRVSAKVDEVVHRAETQVKEKTEEVKEALEAQRS